MNAMDKKMKQEYKTACKAALDEMNTDAWTELLISGLSEEDAASVKKAASMVRDLLKGKVPMLRESQALQRIANKNREPDLAGACDLCFRANVLNDGSCESLPSEAAFAGFKQTLKLFKQAMPGEDFWVVWDTDVLGDSSYVFVGTFEGVMQRLKALPAELAD